MTIGDIGCADSSKCVTKTCRRPRAINRRGLCLICYSKAKRLVEVGITTWDNLVMLRLVLPYEDDLFTQAFNEATKEVEPKSDSIHPEGL